MITDILDYCPETGLFTWKHRTDVPDSWNTKYEGRVAGTLQNKYVVIKYNKKGYRANILAWFFVHGVWPEGQIDHINKIKSDNRIVNLRDSTHGQNQQNCNKYSNNKSGLKGVCWHKASNKWASQIKIEGEVKWLGAYDCPAAASFSYQIASHIYHGEFGNSF